MAQEKANVEDKGKVKRKLNKKDKDKTRPDGQTTANQGLAELQQKVGNRAVQRLLVQRSASDAMELDENTADRIDEARGKGRPIDSAVQEKMSDSIGQDFSGVQVHTSLEADDLNRQLGAKAFTTGQDIFFREGAYDPHSKGGEELLAHELTHVVQQGQDAGKRGGRMVVNPPQDAHEQEADAVAKTVTSDSTQVQKQEEGVIQADGDESHEEWEEVQAKRVQRQEEEELQMKALQRQGEEEEEALETKPLQTQDEEEMVLPKAVQLQEEDELMMKTLQRQPMEEEEEELMPKRLQRQEEEELQMKELQRQEEEEEELMPKRLQRQEELPEEEI